MADPSLVKLRKQLDFETTHKAFLDDFAGWPKPQQSQLIRLVADDDGVLPFLDYFAGDLMNGPTKAMDARMTFLGLLCGRLTFRGPLMYLVEYVAEEIENLGEMGADGFPEMLQLATAIADLNSPPTESSIFARDAALATAIDNLSGFGGAFRPLIG